MASNFAAPDFNGCCVARVRPIGTIKVNSVIANTMWWNLALRGEANLFSIAVPSEKRNFIASVCLLQPFQFNDPSDGHPLFDIEVALFVPADAVRRDENSVEPLLARELVGRAHLGVDLIAEVRDQLVLFIENRHASAEIADHQVGTANVERGWQPELIVLGPVESFDVLAFEREPLQPVIGAVGDQDQRFPASGVNNDRVRRIELAFFFRVLLADLASPGIDVLAFGVVAVNVIRAVAVGDVKIPIRRDGDAGRAELIFVLVDAGFFGIALRPDDFAVDRQLGEFITEEVGQVDELLAALLADQHSVRAVAFLVGLPFLAERFDELDGLVENDDRVLGVGVEIDAILRIDLHGAVSAAQLHAFGQFGPSANPFVAVIAGPENDRVRSGVSGKARRRDCRNGDASAKAVKKPAASD